MPPEIETNTQPENTSTTGGGYPSLEQVQQYQQSLQEQGTNPPPVVEEGVGGEEHSNPGQESVTPEPSTHRIKWNGEEREMSYEELVAAAQQGYDYTQKSQTLAKEREQLQGMSEFVELVNSDPRLQQDLVALMQRYEQNAPEQTQTSQQPQFDPSQSPEFQQLLQTQQQMEQFLHQQQVQKETAELHSKFPESKNIDQNELFKFADENNLKLEQAYKLMTYDNLPSKTKEQMVQQNMKKKLSHTQPAFQATGGQETATPPKSYADIRTALASGNYKLFQE